MLWAALWLWPTATRPWGMPIAIRVSLEADPTSVDTWAPSDILIAALICHKARRVGFYINPMPQFQLLVSSHSNYAIKPSLFTPLPAHREDALWNLPVKILSLDASSFKNFSYFMYWSPSILKSFSSLFIVGHLDGALCSINSYEDLSHSTHCVVEVRQIQRQDWGLAL